MEYVFYYIGLRFHESVYLKKRLPCRAFWEYKNPRPFKERAGKAYEKKFCGILFHTVNV